ncbi:SHOCT domain-containing protein [Kitasatospora sp. NPDC088346]|uniref:SHOCT domain-containing protein n=1 Tax=Kitasatospora sp. NPDC088346 TaxID=3364073 RepID=UPI0038237E1D
MIHQWHHGGMNGWGYGLAALLLIAVLAAVVLLAVLVARQAADRRPAAGRQGPADPEAAAQRPAPERLLAERYALGEIEDEEYRRRLAVLRHRE